MFYKTVSISKLLFVVLQTDLLKFCNEHHKTYMYKQIQIYPYLMNLQRIGTLLSSRMKANCSMFYQKVRSITYDQMIWTWTMKKEILLMQSGLLMVTSMMQKS